MLECELECQNGETLLENCSCQCALGYTGANCTVDIDECTLMPCQHGGTCTDEVNNYICICVLGYTGVNCETNINECDSNPCQNGGSCIDGINNYTCMCAMDFGGKNCSIYTGKFLQHHVFLNSTSVWYLSGVSLDQ